MLSTRYFGGIYIGVCLFLAGNALAQSNAEVLENLKANDSIYESGFSVSGTRRSEDSLVLGGQAIRVERRWRLTFEGGRCAYFSEVREYEKPRFHLPQDKRGPILDEGGGLLLALHTKQWGYWSANVSGWYIEDTTLRVSPKDEVREIGKVRNLYLWSPLDEGSVLPKRTILWSLGRFFSDNIVAVTVVKKSTNGRIAVSASGIKGNGQSGRWELEIEPAATWLVREARFYRDGRPDFIDCEMKNSGAFWSGGPYCIPRNATFNYVGPVKDPAQREDVQELTFDPVIARFDEELFSGAEKAVTKDRPPKLTIQDMRMVPTLISQPKEDIERLVQGEMPSVLQKTAGMELTVPPPRAAPTVAKPISVTPPKQTLSDSEGSWYLLSRKWAVVVLILAIASAACGGIFLLKSRKG